MKAFTALDPRVNGDGQWRRTAPHRRTQLTLLGTVVVCAALVAAFLLLQVAARAGICRLDEATVGYPTHSYCPDYIPTTTTETAP